MKPSETSASPVVASADETLAYATSREPLSASSSTADALRRIAAMLDASPELAPALRVSFRYMTTHVAAEDPKPLFASFARAAKAAGAVVTKSAPLDSYFKITAEFAPGVFLSVQSLRDAVCERVVVGTETVTSTEYDPEAFKAATADLPKREVSETREIVEWHCPSILAD